MIFKYFVIFFLNKIAIIPPKDKIFIATRLGLVKVAKVSKFICNCC